MAKAGGRGTEWNQARWEAEVESLVERMAKLDDIILSARRLLEETRRDVDRMDFLESRGVTEIHLRDGTVIEVGSLSPRQTLDLYRSIN